MTEDGTARRADILLIDDFPRDARLVREALQDNSVNHRLRVVTTLEQALSQLRQQPPDEKTPRPDLELLDLNLRGSSGIDLLQIIKQDAALRVLPVLMFSSSRAQADVLASHRHHANYYLVKPPDYLTLSHVLNQAVHYWLSMVEPAQEGCHV